MKYNTITKQVSARVPDGIYEGIDYHGTPPADVATRAGWIEMTPEIQAQVDADAVAAQAAALAAMIAAIPAELTKAETDLVAIEKTPLSAENGKLAAALLLILRELHPELVAAKEAAKEIEPR